MTDLTGLGDSWEELVSTGIGLAQNLDAGRFALGDVGARVQVVYGEASLAKFSAEIGIARAHTFREYVRVARGYESVTRGTFLEAGLSWSHFRECLRAGDQAVEWLARAADEGWPVAETARQIAEAIGKPIAPKLLWSGEGYVYTDLEGAPSLHVLLEGLPTLQREITSVVVKVYEGGQE